MKQFGAAGLALMVASALATSIVPNVTGKAIVLNSCTYPVYLYNTPAQDGGFEDQDTILSPGQSWSQQWTQLSNGMGWSIKLSQSTNLDNIMQYEYTFHDDGSIWYDLSAVNGNPWDKNWEITSDTLLCVPKDSYYRYSTDDAFGMQWCPQAANITVILCSGESQSDGAVSSISSSVAAASSTAPVVSSYSTPTVPTSTLNTAITTATWTPIAQTTVASTSQAHTSSSGSQATTSSSFPAGYRPITSATYHHGSFSAQANYAEEESSTTVATPTTFATSTTVPVEEANGVTIWEVETHVVTDVVTAIYTAPPSRVRRHEHHGDHHQHAN